MSVRDRLIRRAVITLLSIVSVLTVVFFLAAYAPDFQGSMAAAMANAQPPPKSPRDATTPLWVRYVHWMKRYLLLRWTTGENPIVDDVLSALAVTATYMLPAIVVSSVLGLLVGLYSGLKRGIVGTVGRVGGYLLFAVPTFFGAIALLYWLIFYQAWLHPYYDPERGLLTTYNLRRLAPAMVVMTGGIFAVLVRHARSETVARRNEAFVKLARAKGGGTKTIARHVLRLAVAPLVGIYFAELFSILLLSAIAIEYVFKLPGFGAFLYGAADSQEPHTMMVATLVTLAFVAVGNTLHDVASELLDVRESGAD